MELDGEGVGGLVMIPMKGRGTVWNCSRFESSALCVIDLSFEYGLNTDYLLDGGASPPSSDAYWGIRCAIPIH